MAQAPSRIVTAERSDIHDEPHIHGSRVTVRYVANRVHELGHDPETVADRHGLDPADVYDALAYHKRHPAEMDRVREARKRTLDGVPDAAELVLDDQTEQ
jgi:uncharacterized protein (DUF433 family)